MRWSGFLGSRAHHVIVIVVYFLELLFLVDPVPFDLRFGVAGRAAHQLHRIAAVFHPLGRRQRDVRQHVDLLRVAALALASLGQGYGSLAGNGLPAGIRGHADVVAGRLRVGTDPMG